MAQLAIALFALFSEASGKVANAAGQNYCQYSDRSTLIFVDRTTQYDDVDKELFVRGFERIVSSFQAGDRVSVNTIAGDYSRSERVFDRCVPGCPDSGVLSWLISTCRSMQARADFSDFRTELARTVRRLLDELQSYKRSDIVRTLARVTQAMSRVRAGTEGGRLIGDVFVFSDLLENSDHLPWPGIVRDPPAALTQHLSKLEILPRLTGARVAAFGIGRRHDSERNPLGASDENRLRDAWTAIFKAGGADNVYVGRRLE